MKTIPEQSQWLRADTKSPQIGVDREAKVIRGFVLAQEGPFKDLRGEFDVKGLKEIVRMANSKPGGLKSRFAHPSLSGDGIGSFLGRARNSRMGVAQVERDGKLLELNAVRGDLHLDPTAFATPSGDLGSYIMDLAESDPDAFSSSLVIKPDERKRLDNKGRPKMGEDGMELPPLWYPKALHAIDVVDTGDAVDGFLSAEGLSDSLVRDGYKLLAGFLPGQPRNVVEARLTTWLTRALDMRFGTESALAMMAAPKFGVGDRCAVNGTPHMEGHEGGTVREVSTDVAYGIEFDGMSGIHRWYLEHELRSEETETADEPMQMTADDLMRQLRHKVRSVA